MSALAEQVGEVFERADIYDVVDVSLFSTMGRASIVPCDRLHGIWIPEYVELEDDDDYASQLSRRQLTPMGKLVETPTWEAVSGFSGQYLYSGPVMHPSEYVGGAMAEWIAEHGGLFATIVVEAPCYDYGEPEEFCSTGDGCDCEPAGWMLIRYLGSD